MLPDEREKLKSELLGDLQRAFNLEGLVIWRQAIKRAYARYAFLTSHDPAMPFDIFVAVVHTTAVSRDYQIRAKGTAVMDFLAFATDKLGIP